MISLETLISTMVYLVVAALIFGLFEWLIRFCEVREPFAKVVRVILAVGAVLVICAVLLSFISGRAIFRP